MKVLGKKSLSSKVEKGLKIIFTIITLLNIFILIMVGVIIFTSKPGEIRFETNYLITIFMGAIFMLFYSTGIVALFIIYQFIKIFKNLKENKLFEKDNVKYLGRISTLSIVIGTLYLIVLIGTNIVLGKYISFDLLSNTLIKILIFVFAIAFLVLGVGVKILNEIYKKAIEYKEENDLTV